MKSRIGGRSFVVGLTFMLGDLSWSFSLLPTTSRSSRLLSTTAPQEAQPQGLVKSIYEQGNGIMPTMGDIGTVKYACYYNGQPFCVSNQQKMILGDGTMIPGWELAMRTMQIGERSLFRITDPALGYGATGVPPLIPPQAADIELDIHLLDAQPVTANIDFDALAEMDTTPRTAADIAQAYALRQKEAAENPSPELEGMEAFVEKVRNFYFYGLFEGETGERPPWFLRPSITFPLAFAIVGAAFYVSLAAGGIRERGAPVVDELDEIILTTTTSLMMLAPHIVLPF